MEIHLASTTMRRPPTYMQSAAQACSQFGINLRWGCLPADADSGASSAPRPATGGVGGGRRAVKSNLFCVSAP